MDPLNTSFVAAIANLGAVGIMGYWIMWGLPHTLRQIDASHERITSQLIYTMRDERARANELLGRLSGSMDRLSDLLPQVCRADGQGPTVMARRPPG